MHRRSVSLTTKPSSFCENFRKVCVFSNFHPLNWRLLTASENCRHFFFFFLTHLLESPLTTVTFQRKYVGETKFEFENSVLKPNF